MTVVVLPKSSNSKSKSWQSQHAFRSKSKCTPRTIVALFAIILIAALGIIIKLYQMIIQLQNEASRNFDSHLGQVGHTHLPPPHNHNGVKYHTSKIDLPRVDEVSTPSSSVQQIVQKSTTQLTSGVGLVTTDGQWDISPDVSAKHDIKIFGFTDSNYAPIAKVWYDRLTKLGYNEHYIVAHDKTAYNDLIRQNYRVMSCFIDSPDYKQRVKGLWRQIMAARVKFARDMVKNGTHTMVTDVDNIFSRYVNPVGFVEEGYDVYHAYEMRYPKDLHRKLGFVVCSGHLFFRSSEKTIRFLDMAVNDCGDKCDDQEMFNNLLRKLDIEWDGGHPPAHPGAIRVVSNEADEINNGLLVEGATGRSRITNHTIKIWDRDFAWRLSGGIPDLCPSKNNWLGMPSFNGAETESKIGSKLALFDFWDDYCLNPEADEKSVKLACNNSVADCSLCKSPMCKLCSIVPYGQEKKERTCMIIDIHAAENPFHVKEDWVELSDGSTVKFCGSNKWVGPRKLSRISCNKRAESMAKRYHLSMQDAKISILENGCKCSVDDDKGGRGGDREESLLQQFEDISSLPTKAIAHRYGIPETSRSPPFHVREDWVELSDGSTVKFCGSNKWIGPKKLSHISCHTRAEFMVSRYDMSVQDAKISIMENGCKCSSVDDDKGSRGNREELLLQQFASRKKHFQDISSLPAKAIAHRYGIPETSRSVECLLNGTTHIGWIPRAKFAAEQPQLQIPRIIFQSWKTNYLTYNVCQNVLAWTELNPEYDYMLFDDKAMDVFVQKEYGKDIFDAFGCVNVGAARCDVWRLMVIYIFGGIYFDLDVRPKSAFRFWGFGNRTVVSGRGCNKRSYPTGCAHQWGLIYAPFHTVLHNAIEETLGNLAKKAATHVYDVSFWSFYNAWTKGPFNSSYMPGWGDYMGGRVVFSQEEAKSEMISLNGHWPAANGKNDQIWKSECLS